MKMSARDRERLDGVDRAIICLCERAWALFDPDEVAHIKDSRLIVVEGMRTREKQAEYVAAGKSWTTNSKHLVGRAVDFAVVSGSVAHWEFPLYERVWLACFRPAAHYLGYAVQWGGRWATRDGPHIELRD